MTVQATSNSLEKELEYRKKLTGITNQLNSADSIQHILLSLKDKILELLDADRLTIYAVDTKNQELYSMQKIGDVPKEIRVPKSFASIAGFTALARKTINIKDAYDQAELAKYHPNLRFDQRWDKQSGYRTKSVLAVPIAFEKYLLGVLQLINKRHGPVFTALDEDGAEEIARILGIAFYNQHRAARQSKPAKFGALIDKGIISEKDIDAAVTSARVNNTTVEKVLVDDHNVPKDELGKSLAQFYGTQYFAYDGAMTIPADLKERVPSEMWKKYTCAPVERRPGVLVVAVDDPQDLTRLDGIRAMNLSPRYDFWVGLKQDILQYIASSYGEAMETSTDSADLARIIETLGEETDGEVDEEKNSDEPEIDETDSGIVRLANQLIIEA
ncbi:MAG TPA: GAF domain-containing protein, partial [Thermoanaerobaculia bacterium]